MYYLSKALVFIACLTAIIIVKLWPDAPESLSTFCLLIFIIQGWFTEKDEMQTAFYSSRMVVFVVCLASSIFVAWWIGIVALPIAWLFMRKQKVGVK